MKLYFSVSLFFFLTILSNLSSAAIKVTALKSNVQQTVFFSWQIQSGERNQTQAAYRVWVADSPENLKKTGKLTWDSGQMKSDQSNLLAAAGLILKPALSFFWLL